LGAVAMEVGVDGAADRAVKQRVWTRTGVLRWAGAYRSRLRRQEAFNGFVFILPWLVGLLFLTVYPFISGLYYSFTEFDILTAPNWVGLRNYADILTEDERFVKAVVNTAYYVGVGVLPRCIIGLLLALLLNQELKGITLFRGLFYMPSIVPAVASMALFIYILHDRFGLLNEFLFNVLGVSNPPHWLTSPRWSKPALIIWSMWGVGGAMVIYLAGLQGIPNELYEASSLDGAGTLRRFFSITLPLLSPTIFFVLVMSIIGSFQIFAPVFLLGGYNYAMASAGPQNSLLFWVVFIYNSAFHYWRMGYGSALAWLLFIVIVVLTVLQFRLANRWVFYGGD
jgi:multiple sugar transport system permease protein